MSDNYILVVKSKRGIKEQSGAFGQKGTMRLELSHERQDEEWFFLLAFSMRCRMRTHQPVWQVRLDFILSKSTGNSVLDTKCAPSWPEMLAGLTDLGSAFQQRISIQMLVYWVSPYGKSAGKGSMPHVHLAKSRGCSSDSCESVCWQVRPDLLQWSCLGTALVHILHHNLCASWKRQTLRWSGKCAISQGLETPCRVPQTHTTVVNLQTSAAGRLPCFKHREKLPIS